MRSKPLKSLIEKHKFSNINTFSLKALLGGAIFSVCSIAYALDIQLINANSGEPFHSTFNNMLATDNTDEFTEGLSIDFLNAAEQAAEILEGLIQDDVTVRIRIGFTDDFPTPNTFARAKVQHFPIPYKPHNPINGVYNSSLTGVCRYQTLIAELSQGYRNLVVADERREQQKLAIVSKLPIDATNFIGNMEEPFVVFEDSINSDGLWADKDLGLASTTLPIPFPPTAILFGPGPFAEPSSVCDDTGLGQGYANCTNNMGGNCEDPGAAELIWITLSELRALTSPEAQAGLQAQGFLTNQGNPIGKDVDGAIGYNKNVPWDTDRSDGISANKRDFIGTTLHEIIHILGFQSGGGLQAGVTILTENSSPLFTGLDLYRFEDEDSLDNNMRDNLNFKSFSNPHTTRTLKLADNTNPALHFLYLGENMLYYVPDGTADGGATAPHWLNLNISNDYGVMDPSATNGAENKLSRADLAALDAIGWNVINSWKAIAVPRFSIREIRDLYINNEKE